jgi:hypothetical protein
MRAQLSGEQGRRSVSILGSLTRKLALLLALLLAAATPSLASAAKHHHHHKIMTAEPADPNADTSHLIHDFFLGK